MADKLMLVKHKDCGYCAVMESKLKEKIESGEIGIIDASTKEGYDLAAKLGIGGVPECVKRSDDGTYTKCSLEDLLNV